jgi:hypothetical protein
MIPRLSAVVTVMDLQMPEMNDLDAMIVFPPSEFESVWNDHSWLFAPFTSTVSRKNS